MSDIVLFLLVAVVAHCTLCWVAAELWSLAMTILAMATEVLFVLFVVVLSLFCCVCSIVLHVVASSKRRFSVFSCVVPLSNLPKR